MDDLFFIDTQRSAGVQCTTAAAAREFTVSTSNAASRHSPESQAAQATIQIINDDITTAPFAATATKRAKRGHRKENKRAQRLDSQFLQLQVSEGSATGKEKDNSEKESSESKNQGSKKKNKTKKKNKKAPAPMLRDGSDTDEYMNDYIANMEEEEIAEILAAVEDGAYLERELRDNLECHHQAKVSKGKNAAIPYNIDFDYDDDLIYMENPMEDDMEIVDEIFQSSEDELEANSDFYNNGGYNEDDGFPCSIDPENLPGPERSPRNGRQNNGQAGKSKGNNKRKEKKSPAKNKANGREGPSPSFDPRKVLKRLDMLARSEDMSSLWMEPMNRHERQIVHIFAREYGMRSKSHGSGVRRAPVLTATQDTQIPRQRRRINRILTLYDNGGLIPEEFIGGPSNQGDSSKGKKGNGQRGKGAKCVPSGALHGRLVAADAPAVGSSNIGHKMLQQMGWQPGTGLGVQEEGRSTPVDVMIRGGRRGLGA